MYKFAWNIITDIDYNLKDFNYKYLILDKNQTIISIFILWKTNIIDFDDFIKDLNKNWNIISYDISHESEDNIVFLNEDISDWIYEQVSFEWKEIDINSLVERFEDSYEIVSIRESEISNLFWNRIIKADFIY